MSQALSQEEITKKLEPFLGWNFRDDKIHKDFEFKDHPQTMLFLNALAHYSEKVCHHAEVSFCYNKVHLAFQTHDAGGKVTEKDLQAAFYIETHL